MDRGAAVVAGLALPAAGVVLVANQLQVNAGVSKASAAGRYAARRRSRGGRSREGEPVSPRRLVAVMLVALALPAAGATAASAALPVPYTLAAGVAAQLRDPAAPPPGANDFSCRPSAAHPRPVILVPGTFETMALNWQAASPLLKNAGFCVFALNYGGGPPFPATGPIAASAAELAAFVDRVRATTGAATVDLVGHSQGGMMPRFFLKNLGGAGEVAHLVAITPSNHGTTLDGLGLLARLLPGGSALVGAACPACADQLVGSPFLAALNAGDETPGPVAYTNIATRFDEVVTPYTSSFLVGGTNVTLQSGCPIDLADHLAAPYDRRALRLVLNALDPAHAQPPPCTFVAPVNGG